MNLVRLGMIVALGGIAWYALSIYAQIPVAFQVDSVQVIEKTVKLECPAVYSGGGGFGAILVALTALGGALAVAAVDLSRRVY